jgi:hypothetical protein
VTPAGHVLTLVLASAPIACTIAPTASDAGASDAGSQTVGDQCTAILTELCQQGVGRCGIGLAYTLDECVSANMPTCCAGTTCSEQSLSPEAAVDACKQAIDAEDCNSMANSVTPDACSGVPQKP